MINLFYLNFQIYTMMILFQLILTNHYINKNTSSDMSSSVCPLLKTEVQKFNHSSSDIVPLLSVSTDLNNSSVLSFAKLLFLKM